jgi:nicotinate-nucleotide adenylyltransferase
MPARTPPHKAGAEDPGPEHRLEMCRLLAGGAAGVSACALEIERSGPSFTVVTLEQIHGSHPDAELTFIVGADIAATLDSWHEPGSLLELADLAVAGREGSELARVLDAVARVRAAAGASRARRPRAETVRFLRMPMVSISSSLVRRRAARGQPIDGLVGAAVAGYIREHGLYRAAALEPS